MPSVLLVNPNTSGWVTRRLATHLRLQWRATRPPAAITLATTTARFGASYIASEAAFAIAAHATLDAVARASDRAARRTSRDDPFDAVLVGCFGDPGLFALRSIVTAPVLGLAQAAFDEARRVGRFAIVTGGANWKPMLERIVRAFGHERSLTRIVVVDRSGAELAAAPGLACELLAAACHEAAGHDSDCVVLGGAAFAGFGDLIATEIPVPVIDSVSAAARAVAAAVGAQANSATPASPDSASYRGIHPALAARTGRTLPAT